MHLACVLPSLPPRAQPTARGSPMQPRAGPPPTVLQDPLVPVEGQPLDPIGSSALRHHTPSPSSSLQAAQESCVSVALDRGREEGAFVYTLEAQEEAPEPGRPGLESQLWLSFTVGPWTGYSPSRCLIFLSYINGDNIRTNTS